MSSFQNFLRLVPVAALVGLLAFAPSLAEAAMGGSMRGGMGSRGSRTFSPPPATNTAPSQAAPIQRSVTPPASAQQQPGSSAPQPGMSGGFGRSLLGGLAGGLLGAGLFGLLTGQGFFGGMGGFASIIGLLFQIAFLAFLARLAFQWWQGRQTAAVGLGPRSGGNLFGFDPRAGFGGGGARPGARTQPLQLSAADFPAFERLLGATQEAYSREDVNALAGLATPEMVGYLNEEFDEHRRRGVINKVSGVKLLQGDLSEAWREGSDEYATVAMRFALNDVTEDRATGRIVSGDSTTPTQLTQVWTFRRPAGAPPEAWKLSAMQEAA
jgi:predicted lipid-binding transport protein (Tim44 family)